MGMDVLQKLSGFLCNNIKNSAISHRWNCSSQANACVLGLAKEISNRKDLDTEVRILVHIFMNNGKKLSECLHEKLNSNKEFTVVAGKCKEMSLIHFAAIWNNTDALQVLLNSMSKRYLNSRDVYGFTPLHYAVQFGNVASARLLLDNGADVNSKNQSHTTPLHLAAYYKFPNLIFLLCKHHADVNCMNYKLETPLLVATRSSGHRELRERLGSHSTCISILLRYGSSPNTKGYHQETPLQNVVRHCTNLTCALLLVSAGAELPEVRNYDYQNCDSWKKSKAQSEMWHVLDKIRNDLPMRLEVLCLLATRKTLGSNFSRKLEELHLSRQLKQLLLFQKLPKLV